MAATALISLLPLGAAPHQGVVKFGGLPVPGATVTATMADKKLTAITDPQGNYSFADLADGNWTVRVELLCFEPLEKEIGIAASVPPAQWELKIQALAAMTTVTWAPEPAAAAPGAKAPLVPTGKSAKAKIAAAAATPANTPGGFQRTAVNASADAGKVANETPVPGEMNQNQSAAQDGLLINGSLNNGAASPFGQSAAFGNNRRGARSLYNGSLGMILDNSVWDARPYSLTGQDTPRPNYIHMQGLLALGGPLRLPHVVFKSAPNLSINYQWLRKRNVSTSSALMPTEAQRAGDFSSLTTPIIDPSNGVAFAGNRIPTSRISPQALSLMKLYPLPNFTASSQYNFQIPLLGATHQDDLQTRGNKILSRKDNMNAQFAFQNSRGDSPSVLGFLDTSSSVGLNSNVNFTHRFNQRIFLNAGVQFSRFIARATPFFAGRQNIAGQAGITGDNQEPANWGPPNLQFASGIHGLSDGQRSVTRSQTTGVTGSVFWGRSPHEMTIGGDFRRQQMNLLSQQDPRGSFSFTGAAAGNDFAGFLLGIPDTSSIAFGNADKYFRANTMDAYFSDAWRLRPSLTLNLGVRWEYGAPILEKYGRLVNLDIGPGYRSVAPVVASNPTGPITGQRYAESLLSPDRSAIQPKIGLSWRPFLASSMVIRAGYGLSSDTSVYRAIAVQMAQQSPLSTSLISQNGPGKPLTLANGFVASSATTRNTYAVDPRLRIGTAQSWQISIQRDLPFSLIATATYLGIKGTHAQQQFYPNTVPVGAAPCLGCPTGFTYLTSGGNSTKNQVMAQVRRRLHNGFTSQIQYTFAKALDDASLGGGGELIAQNWLNLRAERGRSNFDQRHQVAIQMQYSTGVGMGGGTLLGGWRGKAFKDWTFASNINAGSGLPLTPVYFVAVGGNTGSVRPDYTGISVYDAPSGRHLNPAALKAPVAGQWGNAGRNSITGPNRFNLNASMARTFRLGDRLNADFRFDATNALNHVAYTGWNTVFNPQFGTPLPPGQMRTMQASIRVRY